MLELFSELVGPMIVAFVLGSLIALLIARMLLRTASVDSDPAPDVSPQDA